MNGRERCESEDAVKRLRLVIRRIAGLARDAIERRVRVALVCAAIVSVLLTLCVGWATRALEAQTPLTVTTISIDARGAATATTASADGPAYNRWGVEAAVVPFVPPIPRRTLPCPLQPRTRLRQNFQIGKL